MEWAPPKDAPSSLEAVENSPEEYGPWRWAAAFGAASPTRCATRCYISSRVPYQEEAANACSSLETVEEEAAYTFTRRSGVREV